MLLRDGYSWSGRERNCVFLNTGGKQFADISGISGMDYLDDGRGLALVDWDQDGDQDVWVTNRTSPRLRLLRNDAASSQHYVAIKLLGDGKKTNRDAIGARLELYTSNEDRPFAIRTLRAGEGFLSQSTKWIHFGLGKNATISRLVVRWPGGGITNYEEISADQHYLVKQGDAAVEAVKSRSPVDLSASEPASIPASDQARVVLVNRVPFPPLNYSKLDGASQESKGIDRPTLVNLWASWCLPCIQELKDLNESESLVRSKLRVIALSVDGVESRGKTNPDTARKLAKKLKLRYQTGLASARLLNDLEAIQRTMLDRNRPLPLPSSFLVDRYGQVAVIYKGPVSAEQVSKDMVLLEASQVARRQAATPFAGLWRTSPPEGDPIQVALMMFQGGHNDSAIDYLNHCTRVYRQFVRSPLTPQKIADMHYFRGTLLEEKKELSQAIEAFKLALAVYPNHEKAKSQLELIQP